MILGTTLASKIREKLELDKPGYQNLVFFSPLLDYALPINELTQEMNKLCGKGFLIKVE